jgi:biopolymer transport protein ExbD
MMANPPAPPGGGAPPPAAPRQKPAPMARYKRELRKEIKRRAIEPEINFLNITAMMDMMTIILVFLLKSLSTSTATIPQSDDLKIPTSELQVQPDTEPDGITVVVSRSKIIVGDTEVVDVPADASKYGIEARYKSGNREALLIDPLAKKLKDAREADKRIRMGLGKDSSYSEAIIIMDNRTPYRLLVEVAYTLGQSEFAKFHLMVLTGSKKTQ